MKRSLMALSLFMLFGCTTTSILTAPAHNPSHYGGKPHFEVIKMHDQRCFGITSAWSVLRYCDGNGTCVDKKVSHMAQQGSCEGLPHSIVDATGDAWGLDKFGEADTHNQSTTIENSNQQKQKGINKQGQYQKQYAPKKHYKPKNGGEK